MDATLEALIAIVVSTVSAYALIRLLFPAETKIAELPGPAVLAGLSAAKETAPFYDASAWQVYLAYLLLSIFVHYLLVFVGRKLFPPESPRTHNG